ncbi:GNAT family N-acetyltransferase [Nonomuraea sp. NPDC050536]|uniref:GNAT family N-acetyltransferase n=1 Tax=Nonomuraea sp. NPDC050536 TaxID=3364366 RepID=UPI0037CBAE72
MIRPRTEHDLDACVEALRQVQSADRYPVDWPTDPHQWLTPGKLIQAWVAVADGVVGHVGIAHADTLEPAVAEALGSATGKAVTRLFVTPAARGTGMAARLLAVAQESVGRLTLEVSHEGVGAIALYERAGWRRVCSTRAQWLDSAGLPALVHHYVSP